MRLSPFEQRMLDQAIATVECDLCTSTGEDHGPQCPNHPDYDPTPWCTGCGARKRSDCHCGPIAENE